MCNVGFCSIYHGSYGKVADASGRCGVKGARVAVSTSEETSTAFQKGEDRGQDWAGGVWTDSRACEEWDVGGEERGVPRTVSDIWLSNWGGREEGGSVCPDGEAKGWGRRRARF